MYTLLLEGPPNPSTAMLSERRNSVHSRTAPAMLSPAAYVSVTEVVAVASARVAHEGHKVKDCALPMEVVASVGRKVVTIFSEAWVCAFDTEGESVAVFPAVRKVSSARICALRMVASGNVRLKTATSTSRRKGCAGHMRILSLALRMPLRNRVALAT